MISCTPDHMTEIPDGNSTTISRTYILGTGVSRHHGDLIKAPLKPLKHHGTLVSRGLRGAFNWEPIIPRGDVNFSSLNVFKHREIFSKYY